MNLSPLQSIAPWIAMATLSLPVLANGSGPEPCAMQTSAYDVGRDQLFTLTTTTSSSLSYVDSVGNTGQVGGLSLPATTHPYNLAFYNDALWYFEDNTNVLKKVALTYTGTGTAAVPSVSAINSFAVLGMSLSGVNTNKFVNNDGSDPDDNRHVGGIAIQKGNGTLYAYTSRGRFYSLDLANPSLSFAEIGSSPGNDTSVGLMLAFDVNETLYGYGSSTGDWYTIDTATGALTQVTDVSNISTDTAELGALSSTNPNQSGGVGLNGCASRSPPPARPFLDRHHHALCW